MKLDFLEKGKNLQFFKQFVLKNPIENVKFAQNGRKIEFHGTKIEFQGEKSSFKLFGKIEFPSKRTKKSL